MALFGLGVLRGSTVRLLNYERLIWVVEISREYFLSKGLKLKAADIEIRQVQKTGTYILKDNILTDPIQVISTKGSEV